LSPTHVFMIVVVEHSSLRLNEDIQEEFIGVTTLDHLVYCLPKTILEPSCSQNYYDLLLSLPNKNEHQCVMDNVLCSYFLVEKDINFYSLIEE
jgi:hypothetical protein